MRECKQVVTCIVIASLSLTWACSGPEKEIEEGLSTQVLFFSNFEKGVDAFTATGSELAELDGEYTRYLSTAGKVDGHLVFQSEAGALKYAADGNFPYKQNQSWSGGVSFWLGVDPARLEADFPEPFHIGRRWDDAVIFVDFDKKRKPYALRFGCYPDKAREITDQTVQERVIRFQDIGWKADAWHHIVVTWSNFNSGRADAQWALFVDGTEIGRKTGLRQDITWNISDFQISFNHYKYGGRLDEIAIFDKMLTPADVKYLYHPRRPLNKLLKKD